MKEQVKLMGGRSDGEITEVYEGAEFVEVPWEIKLPNEIQFGSEVYRRTSQRIGKVTEFPIFIPVELTTSDRLTPQVWRELADS